MKTYLSGRFAFILDLSFRCVVIGFALFALELGMEVCARDVYISPKGKDSNPGTKAKPVATLAAARDLVRQQKAAGGLIQGGLTVWIAGGQYDQQEPFVLNESDSGSPASPVVWRAMPGGQVSITGGKSLPPEAFTRVTDARITQRLSPEAAKQVWQVDLRKLGIEDFGTYQQYGHSLAVCPATLELFFNGEPMSLARYPNTGSLRIGKVIDSGSIPRTGDYSERGGIFEYTDARHERWAGQQDVWFQGTFNYGYADDCIRVEAIQPETKQVKLAQPHLYGLKSGQPYQSYVAVNILDELDSPGEWYLNRETGILYFWPPTFLKNSSIKVSILEDPIICLEGTSFVTLRDLTIEAGRGIGIYLERGTNNLIAGCTVRDVGTSGIFMGQGARQTFPHTTVDDYAGVPVSRRVGNLQGHIYNNTAWDRLAGSGNRVLSCDVYSTGSGGIALSGGSKRELIPGHNSVENCKVHDYNRRNKFLWSGINVDGCGNRIAHCEIYNSDWQGIYVHGNEHIFEYNEIHHVAMNSNDTSPWYLGRDPSDRGNVVRYNYFHHCGNVERMNMGIYCDDSTTGVLVHGNAFYRMHTTHGVLFSNSGWDLVMTNNIVIEPHSHTAVMSAHYYTWYKAQAPTMFVENSLLRKRLLQSVNILAPPYSVRYPELKNYLDPIVPGKEWEGMRPRRNLLAGNLIVGGSKEPISLLGGEHAQLRGMNNLVTNHDPGFVAYEKGNFNLRSDSSVFQQIPGFQPPPVDQMGLSADQFRKKKAPHSLTQSPPR